MLIRLTQANVSKCLYAFITLDDSIITILVKILLADAAHLLSTDLPHTSINLHEANTPDH